MYLKQEPTPEGFYIHTRCIYNAWKNFKSVFFRTEQIRKFI